VVGLALFGSGACGAGDGAAPTSASAPTDPAPSPASAPTDTAPSSSTVPSDTATVTVPPATAGPEPVVVGAVLDLTAPDGAAAASEAALRAVVADLDDRGLLGRPVRLVVRDGAGDLDATVAAAEDVLAAGAALVVLGCRGDLAAAGAAVAEDRDAVAISACAPTPEVGAAVGPATFSLGVPADVEGFALANAAAGWAARNAVAVTDLSRPGSIARCEAFADRFAALDGQVVVTVDLPGGDPAPEGPTPADVVAAAVAQGADVVVSCSGPTNTLALVAGLRAAGWTGSVLAGTGAEDLLGRDPAVVGRVAVVGMVPGPDRADPAAIRRDALVAAAGVPLDDAAFAAAAAVELFAAAVEQAGSTEAADVAPALGDGPVDTVLGTIAFDRAHRLARPVALHLRVLGADGLRTEDVP
jgi:branched-chain amino acid transport system substrate-binding protein